MMYFIFKSNFRMLRSTDISTRTFQHNQLGEPLCSKKTEYIPCLLLFFMLHETFEYSLVGNCLNLTLTASFYSVSNACTLFRLAS